MSNTPQIRFDADLPMLGNSVSWATLAKPTLGCLEKPKKISVMVMQNSSPI